MRWIFGALLALATPAAADVLGLNDYDALFAADGAEIATLADGSEVLSLPGPVQVMRSDQGITTLDGTDGGALGCFVRILSQIAAFEAACDAPFDADQRARLESYRDRALDFYAANAQPPVTPQDARARFEALVEASSEAAARYCEAGAGVRDFMDTVLSDGTAEVVARMTEVPRLPADNPCL